MRRQHGELKFSYTQRSLDDKIGQLVYVSQHTIQLCKDLEQFRVLADTTGLRLKRLRPPDGNDKPQTVTQSQNNGDVKNVGLHIVSKADNTAMTQLSALMPEVSQSLDTIRRRGDFEAVQ